LTPVAIVPIILGGGGGVVDANSFNTETIGREPLPLLNYNPDVPNIIHDYLLQLKERGNIELLKDVEALNRLIQGEITVYSQSSQPTLPIGNSFALWFDTSASKLYLIVRVSTGYFKVQLT
jgi:hypothetical protein